MRLRPILVLLVLVFLASTAFAQTPPYNRTIIVPATGNATADGAALLAAVTGITPTPSSANRWLIKLEPGIYDMGKAQLVMQDYVDIEGSGTLETEIRSNIPFTGSLLFGVVDASARAELRELTVSCISNAENDACQGISILDANPNLTDLRIFIQGSGAGSHWGIRTFNSVPKLDRVDVRVTPAASANSYGIVYGGASGMNITRSKILARNGSLDNLGILFREDPVWSVIRDTTVQGTGGNRAVGVMFFPGDHTQVFSFDNVHVQGNGGNTSIGIAEDGSFGSPNIFYRQGRIYGEDFGVNQLNAKIQLVNSEARGEVSVQANIVRIGSSWLDGGTGSGTVVGLSSKICANVWDKAFTAYTSTCP
ncbi:MAG: hypothetical protein AAGD38_08655 [Acidobacteriota bacterium]